MMGAEVTERDLDPGFKTIGRDVSEVLGEKFDALSVQCVRKDVSGKKRDILHCSATNNPTGEFFDVDWEIEVDEIVGRDVKQMAHNESIKMTTIFPAGNPKTCMPRLGSGRGSIELVCSENEEELQEFTSPEAYPGFKEELQKRGLKYRKHKVNMTPDGLIAIKKIEILWREGRQDLFDLPQSFNTIDGANQLIMRTAAHAPKGGAYDKTDFKITWADGNTYKGRLDVKHPSESNADLDVGRHVRQFAEYVTTKSPLPMAKEDKAEFRRLLKKYQLK